MHRASRVHQMCSSPQWGQREVVMESCCNASKSSRSAWIPVENGRPVAGHFTTTTPMTLPSVRIHPNATSVPLWSLRSQHFELCERRAGRSRRRRLRHRSQQARSYTNWRGHDDVMQIRSFRGLGEPAWVNAPPKCALSIGTREDTGGAQGGGTAGEPCLCLICS